jgi:hypothetical protein
MESEKKILSAYNERELIEKIQNYKHLADGLNRGNLSTGKKSLVAFLKGIIKKEQHNEGL